jgi:phospholipid/cholesterol/gamma-HCH transport system permease protein
VRPSLVAAIDVRRHVGRTVLRTASHAGRFTALVVELFRGLGEWRVWVPRTIEQAQNIGYGSLLIVLLIAGFAGAVTALQSGYQLEGGFVPLYYAGGVVTSGVILELGPVLTALILAGRVGARYAAELGTMRVTEQIDALESLGRSPVTHLLLPRIVSGVLVIPALTIIANAMGIASGYFASVTALDLNWGDFTYGARFFFKGPFDLWYSLIKAYFFSLAVTVIPCYIGYNTQQGAEGVGRATTSAVVSASITVLLLDTTLAKVLLG